MNTYLIQSKTRLIRQAQQDLLDVYGIDYTPFTRKIYFYFFELNGKKYIHKESLKFVYSNAETYTTEIDPYYCHLTKEYNPVDVCLFLESHPGDLLPTLLDKNDRFLVYEYIKGTPVESITEQEFYILKDRVSTSLLTPFYNSMAYNLARTDNDIKLIDLKHFEIKTKLPFFIYLYNKDNNINILYVDHNTQVDEILKYLAIDYPTTQTTIIEYKRTYETFY